MMRSAGKTSVRRSQSSGDAFTRTFNSLVDNIDWDIMGRTVGAGITTLIRTFNRLTDPATGIEFRETWKRHLAGTAGNDQ